VRDETDTEIMRITIGMVIEIHTDTKTGNGMTEASVIITQVEIEIAIEIETTAEKIENIVLKEEKGSETTAEEIENIVLKETETTHLERTISIGNGVGKHMTASTGLKTIKFEQTVRVRSRKRPRTHRRK
jgi:hypothetical protein